MILIPINHPLLLEIQEEVLEDLGMEEMVLTISEEDIKEDMMMEDTQVILREEDNTYNSSVILIFSVLTV